MNKPKLLNRLDKGGVRIPGYYPIFFILAPPNVLKNMGPYCLFRSVPWAILIFNPFQYPVTVHLVWPPPASNGIHNIAILMRLWQLENMESRTFTKAIEMIDWDKLSLLGLLQIADTDDKAFAFAVETKLISLDGGDCDCGERMTPIGQIDRVGGVIFRCTRAGKRCRKARSVLTNTWFEQSRLSLGTCLALLFCYCLELSNDQIAGTLGIASGHTTSDWQGFFRDVCILVLTDETDGLIGGPGLHVEIDETFLFRRKAHTGRLLAGESRRQWLVGGICRETRETFFQITEDRSAESLTSIVRRNVRPSTSVITDCWGGYVNLGRAGFSHDTVNHSENFVNPNNISVHTQTVERLWKTVKAEIPKASKHSDRIYYVLIAGYKTRYNWHSLKHGMRFKLLLNHVSHCFPGCFKVGLNNK